MNLDKLFTKESTIKISVISINDKKITKSIFNQLNIKNPFDKHINLLENVLFLGYINDKTKWIIWKDNDFLYKYELKHLLQIKWIDVNRNTIKDLLEIYPTEVVKNAYHFVDDNLNEYKEETISNTLNREDLHDFIYKQDMINKIIENITKRQIFV